MPGSAPQRLVLKIGTGVLTRADTGELNHAMLARIVQSLSDLMREGGHEVLLVSSGAVGAGLPAFGLTERPTEDTSLLQACAAVGQARLMQIYDSGFRNFHIEVAQLLLTHEDFEHEKRRSHIENTLRRLLSSGNILPVINENDSVATFELRFGDNDKLSVQVARLIQADQLMLFTSVPGLRRPDSEDPQDIVSEVHDIREVLSYADASSGPRSVGGMRSKLEAVSTALDCGIPTLIADGHHPEQLSDLLAGKGVATRFFPRSDDR